MRKLEENLREDTNIRMKEQEGLLIGFFFFLSQEVKRADCEAQISQENVILVLDMKGFVASREILHLFKLVREHKLSLHIFY